MAPQTIPNHFVLERAGPGQGAGRPEGRHTLVSEVDSVMVKGPAEQHAAGAVNVRSAPAAMRVPATLLILIIVPLDLYAADFAARSMPFRGRSRMG